MPIYEYQCRNCDHYLDALQKLSDPLLTDCPECGRPALRRLISAPNFRLKGSGWYETDFKSGNRRNIADGGESADKGDKPKEKDEAGKDKAGKEKAGKEKVDKAQAGKQPEDKARAGQSGRKSPADGRKSGRAKKVRGDDKTA
jgi:putative FmdB family regulatory protein